MKQLLSMLIITLTINVLQAQNNPGNFDLFENTSIEVGGGVIIPQGKLSNYIGATPFMQISGHFPLKNNKSFGLSLQLAVPSQKDDFLYRRTIDTIQVKASAMINFSGELKKSIIQTKKSVVNIKLGIGVSAIITDARNPFYSGQEGEEKYETITAMLISPGLEFRYEFSTQAKFIFGIGLHYAPYKVEGAVRENIGGFALVPKITYVF